MRSSIWKTIHGGSLAAVLAACGPTGKESSDDTDGTGAGDMTAPSDPSTTGTSTTGEPAGPVCMDGCTCGPDGDADGIPDDCDSCPAEANADDLDGVDCLRDDADEDGFGLACDPCPLVHGTGLGTSCCDPRVGGCISLCIHPVSFPVCMPTADGLTFQCGTTICGQSPCCSFSPCASLESIPPEICHGTSYCTTRYCTVGGPQPCDDGLTCLPWFKPGEAPSQLADLGVCVIADSGPCVGKVGRECTWAQ